MEFNLSDQMKNKNKINHFLKNLFESAKSEIKNF